MMVRPRGFWVRFWTAEHSLKRSLAGRNVPRAAQEVPAPKERDPKHAVKQSISLILFEFTAFVSGRSGHCTGTCRCREAHGKDCSRQSFCISSIPGGQMCESGLVRNLG